MKLLVVMMCYMALASPAVCLIGMGVGIWARRTRLAPRFGISLVALATILLLCASALLIYDRVRPHGDPDLNGMVVGILGMLVCGPQSLLLTLLVVTTAAIALKRRRMAAKIHGTTSPPWS